MSPLAAHVDHPEVDPVGGEADLVDLAGALARLQNVLSRRDVVDAADPLSSPKKIAGKSMQGMQGKWIINALFLAVSPGVFDDGHLLRVRLVERFHLGALPRPPLPGRTESPASRVAAPAASPPDGVNGVSQGNGQVLGAGLEFVPVASVELEELVHRLLFFTFPIIVEIYRVLPMKIVGMLRRFAISLTSISSEKAVAQFCRCRSLRIVLKIT